MDSRTSPSFLEDMKNRDDRAAWMRAYRRFQPLVFAFARKLGLETDDAEEAVQRTLVSFSESYLAGKYDPARARLRSWVFGIAFRKIQDVHLENRKRPLVIPDRSSGTGFLEGREAAPEAARAWEEEWHRHWLRVFLDEARQRFKEENVTAFELYVLQEWSAQQVADYLEMTRANVFLVKNRITTFLRERFQALDEQD